MVKKEKMSVTIDKEVVVAVKKLAKEEGRSNSSIVDRMLKKCLKK